jgi:hypothetical protein
MSTDDKAHCRGCHRQLDGHPYYTGKPAYLPESGVRALAHHFGGWVCSAECERRVFRDMQAANVWSSDCARMMAAAYDRHEANR